MCAGFLRLGLGLVVPLLLAGCVADVAVAVVGIEIPQRSPGDMVVSAITGRDCSVVHLDKREPYCRPMERAPEPPKFCTRSLGVVDCWAVPADVPNSPRGVADGPRWLTPEQEARRTMRWPGLW
jgi:hypothetical protein